MSTQTLTQRYAQEYEKNMSWLISGFSVLQQKVSSILPKSKAGRTALYSFFGLFAVVGVLFLSMQDALAASTKLNDETKKVVDTWIPDAQNAMFLVMMGLITLGILVSVYGVLRSLFR